MGWTASPQPVQELILELILAGCSHDLNKPVDPQQHLSTQTTHGALDQAKGDYSASVPPCKSKSSHIIPQWQQLSTIFSYRGVMFPILTHLGLSRETLDHRGEGGSVWYTSSSWLFIVETKLKGGERCWDDLSLETKGKKAGGTSSEDE